MNTQEIAAQLWDKFPLLLFGGAQFGATVTPKIDLRYPLAIKLHPSGSRWLAEATANRPERTHRVSCRLNSSEAALKTVIEVLARGVDHYDADAADEIRRLAQTGA
jgi:hypothetical protein